MRRRASQPSAPDPVTATIRVERIGAEGDGVGGPSGNPVYIPLTLPGETVIARMTGDRGALDVVLEASEARVSPPCPHFGVCGGCTLQHWRDGEYAAWKSEQLEAALRRAGYADFPFQRPSRTPPGARRRADLALRRTGDRVAIGLHRLRAAEIVEIDGCLVLHPALLRLLPPLRVVLAATRLLRREGSAVVNLLDTGPDLLLRTDAEPSAADRTVLAAFARDHGIPRISWAKGNGQPEPVATLGPAETALGGASVFPPPGAFLQASAEGERAIAAAVLAGLPERRAPRARAVELFAGCGTLTFPLAGEMRVAAYEGDAASAASLRQAANRAGLGGRIEVAQRDLARQPLSAKELAGAAAVVLDPPHQGALAQMPAIAQAGPERVVYVSCNPAALARDARILHTAGYALTSATLVDQFLWSARIESVIVFTPGRRKRESGRP